MWSGQTATFNKQKGKGTKMDGCRQILSCIVPSHPVLAQAPEGSTAEIPLVRAAFPSRGAVIAVGADGPCARDTQQQCDEEEGP